MVLHPNEIKKPVQQIQMQEEQFISQSVAQIMKSVGMPQHLMRELS